MPESQDAGFINQTQYNQYTAAWLELLNSGSDDALRLAFQAPSGARINFSIFSIDQILALVSAADVALIKARFLLMPDAAGQSRFSVALFAVDASGHRLTDYYIPTQAAASTTQAVIPSTEPSTEIPSEEALRWLTDWVAASALATALFATSHGPMHGYNFEVSTFQDPLAGGQPYDDKSLFLNCGLNTEAGATLLVLVVYVGLTGSRAQGSLAGIPEDGTFYDNGTSCPPSP